MKERRDDVVEQVVGRSIAVDLDCDNSPIFIRISRLLG